MLRSRQRSSLAIVLVIVTAICYRIYTKPSLVQPPEVLFPSITLRLILFNITQFETFNRTWTSVLATRSLPDTVTIQTHMYLADGWQDVHAETFEQSIPTWPAHSPPTVHRGNSPSVSSVADAWQPEVEDEFAILLVGSRNSWHC